MEYIELYSLNSQGTVSLIREKEGGELFVRKEISVFDRSVYDYLMREKPNGIPRIVSCEESENGLIVVEEYVNGRTLQSIIEERGPLEYETALGYLKDICRILLPLHKNNPPIVHRDIKPSNILITGQGTVYLLDFNAATKYTNAKDMDTVLIGTTGYAAPEQYGFKASDPRTDIFALGRTAEEMFTGEKAAPENYVGPLSEIIKKCLKLDPENRYLDANDLLESLEKASDNPLLSKSIKQIHRESLLPPGFRTHTPWKMIVSGLYYAFWLFALYSSMSGHDPKEWFGDIIVVLFVFVTTFFFANYRGIHQSLPLTRSDKLPIKVTGLALYFIVIYIILLVLYQIIQTFTGLA
ncbi:MAG: serine/threonine protein kinase [Firmicutes bacterium]|nr:serine/threonine protein kinase [Bacillota bacterium]